MRREIKRKVDRANNSYARCAKVRVSRRKREKASQVILQQIAMLGQMAPTR